MNIEKIIENNQGGTVLFLGRVTNFTAEELTNFLEAQGMNYADKYTGQNVAITVLSTMLTPLEEDTSYELYDAKVPELRLAQFEEFYTTHIKPNTLMMSLKLSNDQERLMRQLKNESFPDEVYLKLFKMYDWGSDGVYENDNNRDITITFVQRFFKPDGFRDPAMVYSPITLSNIARDAKSANILDAMLSMPNHEIKQSRREDLRPKNLHELVALNQNISSENIRYLLSFNDERINSFLACNNAINSKEQEHIYANSNDITKRMFTQNANLDNSIFKELLIADTETVKSLLTFQSLTLERLEIIFSQNLSEDLLAYIGENRTIIDLTEKLLGVNEKLDYVLASNPLVKMEQLEKLYGLYGEKFILPLSSNSSTSSKLLEKFYKNKNKDIINNLAANKNTAKFILKELCKKNIHDINRHLALNSSVDLEYLEQFALDSELIMIMTQNNTYLESITHK
jgi:hypothetical protein